MYIIIIIIFIFSLFPTQSIAFEFVGNVIEDNKLEPFSLKKKAVGILYQKDDDAKLISELLERTWLADDNLIQITDSFYMAQDNTNSAPIFLGRATGGGDRIFYIKDHMIRGLFSIDKRLQGIVLQIINLYLWQSVVITTPYDGMRYPTDRMIDKSIDEDDWFRYSCGQMSMALKNPDGTYDFYTLVGIFKKGKPGEYSEPYLWYYVQYEITNDSKIRES